ncbi:longitudinals lacking protein, isoforms H/M/V isoform X11 [Onthophagus taurus]|uniref:longitudinals lacking protein, isoforms H/M/V isoform X11 n=1 Tax=Onthophagus taurus TaxID=166361 RepID=UPI000C20D4B6|nr:longitudinals lacking protein, isoforms N/O/W/X/Y isoform X14 [Onthophagus taurus]XP_022903220.1 longitudinals lacking protein, isoforms N/O/W/X/Y isoform X14 [Onthophagus taurus]
MEDDQQFCLRWNNHQSTLVAVFDTLLENGTLVDCTLAAEGKYLNAHKVVLSACSPYFESLLSQNYDKHPIFILKDVKYQELKAMMDYMYRGEVNISQDQLGALLKAAESLQIKGLSDNRKGETETKKTVAPPPPPPVSKSPPPSAALPRVQGLTIEQRRREMEESREGSQSPGARKRKRIRRRSLEDIENHHDASNSSESHHSSSHAPAQNIPTALSAAAAAPIKVAPPSTDVPEPVESKSEILTRHKPPTAIVAAAAGDPEITQVPTKEKLETHSELMLEPKAEYIDEMNEDSIEDLTLDDDDISNMEQMDDSGAGPSHGNLGEASGQGFGGWHMGNQSQDEVFLAAQEAVGAHRDSQGGPRPYRCDRCNKTYQVRGSLRRHIKYDCGRREKAIVTGYSAVNDAFMCNTCGRVYKVFSSMKRHIRYECEKLPTVPCPVRDCQYKAKMRARMLQHVRMVHNLDA